MSSLPAPLLAELSLGRPLGLLLLALPLVLLILSRLRPQPQARFTGALRFWKDLGERQAGATRRKSMPLRPVIYVVLLALSLGAFGAAGCADRSPPAGLVWRVLLDDSPSMFLGSDDDGAQSASRLERGVDQAMAKIASLAAELDRVQWTRLGREPVLLTVGERPERQWLGATRASMRAPQWSLQDRAGDLWVTDGAPEAMPKHAGLIAIGGGAAPGPVALDGDVLLLWDGERLLPQKDKVVTAHVNLMRRGPSSAALVGVDNPLADLFELWARERHLEFSLGYLADSDLTLSFSSQGEGQSVCSASGGRWGLKGTGEALPLKAEVGLEQERAWLRGSTGPQANGILVAASEGHIRLGWAQLGASSGDAAAFALAWGKLFDACLRPPLDVIPLSERRAPGAALQLPMDRPEGAESQGSKHEPWSRWLATAAAALALVALLADHGKS